MRTRKRGAPAPPPSEPARKRGGGSGASSRAVAAAPTPPPPSAGALRALIASLPRSALEAALAGVASGDLAASGVARHVADVALPVRAKRPRGVPAPVPAHAALVASGAFSVLDAGATVAVLKWLPLEDRVACVTAVCAGWRALRKDGELWRSVCFYPNSRMTVEAGMRVLREVVPAGAVYELKIMWDDSFPVSLLRRVAVECGGAFGGVKRLYLFGKKVSTPILTLFSKHPFFRRLELLSLRGIASSVSLRDVLAVLPPHLQVLNAGCPLIRGRWSQAFSSGDIFRLAQVMGDARAAELGAGRDDAVRATPLLTDLVLGSCDTCVSAGAFLDVGANFPELRSLQTYAVSQLNTVFDAGSWSSVYFNVKRLEPKPTCFPRLRELDLPVGQRAEGEIDVRAMNKFLSVVVASTPVLEKLVIRSIASYSKSPAKPTLKLDSPLPSTLRELSLSWMCLTPTSFPEKMSLPSLVSVELSSCDECVFGTMAALSRGGAPLKSIKVLELTQYGYGRDRRCYLASGDAGMMRKLSLASLRHFTVSAGFGVCGSRAQVPATAFNKFWERAKKYNSAATEDERVRVQIITSEAPFLRLECQDW